jgi:hypothetical protein
MKFSNGGLTPNHARDGVKHKEKRQRMSRDVRVMQGKRQEYDEDTTRKDDS